MTKILMICHGNICRSTMAEFVLKDMVEKLDKSEDFFIQSAGTSKEEIGSDTHSGTKKKLTQENIPFTKRSARQVVREDYEKFDFLICMDNNNLRNLDKIIGSDTENKVSKLLEFAQRKDDIADPWYTGNFDETYYDIVQGCKALLEKII